MHPLNRTNKGVRPLVRMIGGALAAFLAVGSVAGCGDDGDPMIPTVEPYFPADFASTYTLVRACRFSNDHNLSRVAVYVDSMGAQSYLNGDYPLPVGTICVKTLTAGDDTSCGGPPTEYVAMKKGPPGTAPSQGDWLWQAVNPDRSVRLSGTLFEECTSCHAACTDDDPSFPGGRDFTCTDP